MINKKQQSYLSVLEGEHHDDSKQESNGIENTASMEVRLLPVAGFSCVNTFFTSVISIECKEEGDEKSRNDHVTQTEHAKHFLSVFTSSRKLLGEDKLDRALHTGGNLHHHLCSKHPENVVDKQSSLTMKVIKIIYQKDAANFE